jgi:hypothetical protein
VFHNKNIPSDPNFKISPKELFTINCNYNEEDSTQIIKRFKDFDLDSKGNIFILDSKQCEITKFDRTGKFIKKFGKQGKGPGESSISICMTVLNDTIMYDDYEAKQILKFDTEGNFISKINYPPYGSSEIDLFKAVNKTTIVGYNAYYENLEDGFYITYDLIAMNSKFEKQKDLLKNRIKFVEKAYNYFDIFLTAFTYSNDQIYVAEKSDSKYQINVFNSQCERLYSIKKNYARIQFNDEEFTVFGKKFKNEWIVNNNKSRYKSAITQMEVDKNGRLWVFSSVNRDSTNQFDLLADIFKDGIFLKQIKLDICKGYDYANFDHNIRLVQDRIFYINSEEQYMKVYEY